MIKVEFFTRELKGTLDSGLKLSVQSTNVYLLKNEVSIAAAHEDFESKFVLYMLVIGNHI